MHTWLWIGIAWAAGLVGFLTAALLAAGKVRVVTVPSEDVVKVRVPVAVCAQCFTTLRAGAEENPPPKQLYLELWDCHGNQRAKWAVGEGEQLTAARTDVEWHRVWKDVRGTVARINAVDFPAPAGES